MTSSTCRPTQIIPTKPVNSLSLICGERCGKQQIREFCFSITRNETTYSVILLHKRQIRFAKQIRNNISPQSVYTYAIAVQYRVRCNAVEMAYNSCIHTQTYRSRRLTLQVRSRLVVETISCTVCSPLRVVVVSCRELWLLCLIIPFLPPAQGRPRGPAGANDRSGPARSPE